MLMLMTITWLLVCQLNAYLIIKIFLYNIGNSEVNVFCKHKRSMIEIYPSKTLQSRMQFKWN